MIFPKLKLTKNAHLIEILASIQIVGLAIALVCGAFWIKSNVGSIVRKQIFSDNQLIAEQLGNVIRMSHSDTIEFDSQTWSRLQTLVEEIELPNQGFVCIADRKSGQLLCHPDLRKHPELRKSIVGSQEITIGDQKATIISAIANQEMARDKSITGLLEGSGRVEIVSAADLGSLGAMLLVHQNEVASRSAVDRFLTPLGFGGLVIGSFLIALTTKASVSVLKRYESALATLNRELEGIVQVRTRSLMRTRDAVIFGLAKLSESRDSDTGEHLERIRYYATKLAEHVQGDSQSKQANLVDQIGLASSLHDIGKVGIPDRVLLKPGKLDLEERRAIEMHTVIGEHCLEAIEEHLGQDGFLMLAKEICAYHHEKWDGTGYPYGLIGKQIPISARIVAVADVYDALRSRRPYKEPMSHEAACEMIIKGSEKHFDPQVVKAFMECKEDFKQRSTLCAEAKLELTGSVA